MCENLVKPYAVGTNVPVHDAIKKVSGSLRYTGDIKLPHMLHCKVLFSPLPHAKITKIDTSKAEALEGVNAVVCYKDSPGVLYNGNGEDKDFYKNERVFDQVVRYVGDKVAAVAAETEAIAKSALQLIEVEYEELPHYLDMEEAMKEDAYPIHGTSNIIEEVHLNCGDVDKAMEIAYKIYEDTYTMPAVHHGAMEPHVSIADYDSSGKLTIYTPTQDVFGQRENLHRIFSIPMNKIRVLAPAIGGAFGGKIDLITEPITALLSMKTGRPVKLVYNRREDICSTRTRHSMKVKLRTGVTKEGVIVAQDVLAIMNAGAYTSATMSVCWAMGGKLFKLHKTSNLRYRGVPVYTNTAIAGAMRGFGSPQLYYPQQSQMNAIAKDLNIDIIEMQMLNLVDPYDVDKGSGEKLGNARVKDCVRIGADAFEWKKNYQVQLHSQIENERYRIGIGMASASHGNGIYGVMSDTTGIIIKMNEDGSAMLFTGVSDLGSGTVTAQLQVVSEVLGIPVSKIGCIQTDTDATMWDLGAYSSRGVFVSCHAAKMVAEKVRHALAIEAAQLLDVEIEELVFAKEQVYDKHNSVKKVTLKEVMKHAHDVNERDICETGTFANCSNSMSYGAHFAKVKVDIETGEVKVLDYVAVHDVGKAINPQMVEGQIQGAIQIGMGYVLSEEIVYNEKGKINNTNLKKYQMMHTSDMPKIQVKLVDSSEDTGPFGAKSIGECSIVPVAGAISNAIENAVGKRCYKIPLNPNSVLECIRH